MQDEFKDYYKMIGLKVAYYRKLNGSNTGAAG